MYICAFLYLFTFTKPKELTNVRILKFLHRWFGALAAVILIFFAMSGIVLNHRSLFSPIDIPRSMLPNTYRFDNWNFAAVKSAEWIAPDSVLVYGNIGIWLTDSTFSHFESYFDGMRRGTDNRRTASVLRTPGGMVLAGTMSGLYMLLDHRWEPIRLPVREQRITGMTIQGGDVIAMTRSHIVRFPDLPVADPGVIASRAEAGMLPRPEDYKRETSLFRALWVIHSGEILGLPGKLFVDAMGLALIFLCVSGLIWFFAPDMTRAVRNRLRAKSMVRSINRFSFRWHNKLGILVLAFLIISALTGIFLRPPLLIPIARKTVPAIRHTLLDHPNPWHDKLRDIRFDRTAGSFLISTSDGFYYADPAFREAPRRVPHQPPVSVMGINVFEQESDSVFIVGSFSGLYRWNPADRQIRDKITGLEVNPARGMVNPFGAVAVAGLIRNPGSKTYVFDYTAGAFSREVHAPFPAMPEEIRRQTGMPLWNLALEVHTGRFYSFILGRWYILFIPLAGLTYLVILVTGGIIWFKRRRRKSIP